jgi:HlyD family secretion protein
MKFSLQTLIWTCVLLALLIAGFMALLPKPVNVDVATVLEQPLRVTVEEDGKTRIREKYIISAPVAGRLGRIELDPGDRVSANETLVAVIMPADPSMLDARSKVQAEARVHQAETAVKRAEANIEQVRINYDLSQAKYDRAKKLLATKAISEDEHEIVRADYLANKQRLKTAEFDSEIAQFELDMAEAALMQFKAANTEGDDASQVPSEPFELFAPISGQVLRIFQESSTVLMVGTPLIEVGDPRNLEIEIDVLSTDAVKIKPGAALTIDHWGGDSPLKGIVRVVEPAAFTKISSLGVEEQRVNVIADFDEPPERIATLGDGYRVEADITIEESDQVLQVPSSALFRYRREWHVFRVVNGRAELRKVEIGMQNDSQSQILKGLAADDLVVVYPSDDIQDGSSVNISR